MRRISPGPEQHIQNVEYQTRIAVYVVCLCSLFQDCEHRDPVSSCYRPVEDFDPSLSKLAVERGIWMGQLADMFPARVSF